MVRLSKRGIAAVVGVVLLAAGSSAASAHVMGAGGIGGHLGHGGFGRHVGHHGHGFRAGYFTGLDDGYYDYDGYGCGYLRHRAHETGRPYWWRRYEACLAG